ncbi:MAG TPA: hypothetical protein VHE09_12175 [Rhizomicrobium sp.]|jgi:hypothetical protein|nr:hypothetical protein [Rhizomicrobium sp.]
MKISLPAKIVFWMAIFVSGVWLAFTALVGFLVLRHFLYGGSSWRDYSGLEMLIVAAFALQPFLVLWLIIRAILLRGDGQALRIVARALYPFATVILLLAYIKAHAYLEVQEEMRREIRWHTGSIAYACHAHKANNGLQATGPIEMTLTEHRHLDQLSDWVVERAGERPIAATSFHARTGSIGGSQGIKWQDADGQKITAYLSFSDMVSDDGPLEIYVALLRGDAAEKATSPEAMLSIDYVCVPNPASYRE